MDDRVVLGGVARPSAPARRARRRSARTPRGSSASRPRVCARIAAAASRSASQSGTSAAARSRFSRTNQSAWSCQCARGSSATKRAAALRVAAGRACAAHGSASARTSATCMNRSGRPLAPREPLEVHEAGDVGAGHDLRAGAGVVGDPVLPHEHGDRLLRDREGAAEAAALVGARERHELDALRASGAAPSTLFVRGSSRSLGDAEAELAQPVAALVQRRPGAGSAPSRAADAEDVDEELAQLVGAAPSAARTRARRRGTRS